MLSLLAALLVAAQDAPTPPPAAPAQDPALQDGPQKDPAHAEPAPPSGFEAALTLIPRLSRFSGTFNKSTSLKYEELWGGGAGLSAELDLTGDVGKHWRMGGYVTGGGDLFSGGDADLSPGPVGTIEAEDLVMGHFMMGFKVRLSPGDGFYFDGRAGFGLVHYAETEGTLTGSGDITVFASNTVGAAELAAHVGYSTPSIILAIGFAVRQQEAPDHEVPGFARPDDAVVSSLEIEIGFRF